MNITRLLTPFFAARARRTLRSASDPELVQLRQLKKLIANGRRTLWGDSHHLQQVATYDDFREAMPVTSYPDIRPYVERMIAGEPDILWPGPCRRFAQSSGTSDGKSKYIPVTDDSLRLNHYRGGAESVAHYLNHHPGSRLFDGKAFILGGSFANELHGTAPGVKVGDLSAHLIERINPLVDRIRVPSRATALMPDWTAKLPALVDESIHADVTNISGVPSWFLTVIRRVIERAGASTIHDVWPRLEVFFHGGIAFGPYRSQYEEITDPGRMHYLETYNASEGFFAVQHSPDAPGMMLLTDAGVFYEFVPLGAPDSEAIPAWLTTPGQSYSLLLSAPNGLWRYQIGDVVKVVATDPLQIVITGRTKHYINAFGEEVMVHNTDAALALACADCRCTAANYTAAPVFTTSASRGHHQWLIEFDRPPADIDAFATTLDRRLTEQNSDYQAKRAGDIFLAPLTVTVAHQGLFDRWLASTGKLGGQRKVPRLQNDRTLIDDMLRLNNDQTLKTT
ncbi:hypothetical protein EEL50_11620 [Muribaculaceae bacterium Isolate-105 (HZI)]|nr:hypothetical protein EEL50_11620 [Muribaculaceae bacterium Isolate-105 (HZI)]